MRNEQLRPMLNTSQIWIFWCPREYIAPGWAEPTYRNVNSRD